MKSVKPSMLHLHGEAKTRARRNISWGSAYKAHKELDWSLAMSRLSLLRWFVKPVLEDELYKQNKIK